MAVSGASLGGLGQRAVRLVGVAFISLGLSCATAPPPAGTPLTTKATAVSSPTGATDAKIIFVAALDGSRRDLAGPPCETLCGGTVKFLTGAIELSVPRTGATASIDLNVGALPIDHRAEIDVSIGTPATIELNWTIRANAAGEKYVVRVYTAEEGVVGLVFERPDASAARGAVSSPLIGPALVPGLRLGDRFVVGVSVNADEFRLFLNGQEVGRAVDRRMTSYRAAASIEVRGVRSDPVGPDRSLGGTARIHAVRYYELAR